MPRGLSPLQKWILVRAADNHALGRKGRWNGKEYDLPDIGNPEVIHDYFKVPFRDPGTYYCYITGCRLKNLPISLDRGGQKFTANATSDAARSAASRAITRLERRGLLKSRRFIFRGTYITDEGVRLAAQLRQTVEPVQICTPLTEGQTVEPGPIGLPLTVAADAKPGA
jgi:hypothetical protein